MRLQLAYITPRGDRLKSGPAQSLVQDFVQRATRYIPTSLQAFRTEQDLLSSASRRSGRTPPLLVLLDSRGRSLTSVQFADFLGQQRDTGTQDLTLAIGPADGWSPEARKEAHLLLSLGPMTLPHELALVVLAEQTYRALTILAGHPYHSGHD